MIFHSIDFVIIALFFLITLLIGWITMRRSGKDSSEFFLSGRSMPWWLLGFSMVATTFSPGTPNLVTDIVRQHGISGNWIWWVFLLTGMITVFIYAKLWRRLGVLTDIEFYEVRYSGKIGAFLRGFRTLYLGLLVNTVIMAIATLALIKILAVFGVPEVPTIVLASVITVIFSACGGFAAVLWTDFFLFIVAMIGAVGTAIVVLDLPQIGGLHNLLLHKEVVGRISFFPDFKDTQSVFALLIVPFAVQWWSTWYPGSEPGGGSYTAQRMLAAKNEAHAVGATLFFNVCHYAVRPWAWLIVALASLVCFPTLESLREVFPAISPNKLGHDMAYPAMLTFLPKGLLGVVVASLFAAYMSTISTHLNLGSSYMVNDWYHRFRNPNATEKQLVWMGRIWTIILMVLSGVLALYLTNALAAFQILMMIGAGTGLLFLLRWFWWRINAWSEISAMIISFIIAVYFKFIHFPFWTAVDSEGKSSIPDWLNFSDSMQLILAVGLTTFGWIIITFLTPPTDEKTLRDFVRRTRANGPGWKKIIDRAKAEGDPIEGSDRQWSVPVGIFCSIISCIAVYAALFATGSFLYGNFWTGIILSVIGALGFLALIPLWKRIVS
ncbi:MAG: sodium:solute symporter family protein [Planctomycetia bacterium]|nr:sodium:solute symporter family protein [Planctomycetia bacterium]